MPAVRRGDTSRLIQSEKVKLLILKTTKNSITTYYSTKPDFVPLCRHSCAGPEVAWPQPLGNSRWDTKIHKGSSRKITATRVISDLLGSSLLPSYRVPFVPLLLSHLSPRFSWMPMPWWLRILNLQESNSPKWVLHFQKEVVHEPIEWAFKRRTKVRMLKPWISSSYHNWNTELPEIRTELELRTELEHWETVQKHWELAHDRLMIGLSAHGWCRSMQLFGQVTPAPLGSAWCFTLCEDCVKQARIKPKLRMGISPSVNFIQLKS